jgi:predicted aminopeptidase
LSGGAVRLLAILCVVAVLPGCSTLGYYLQAVGGHWELMRAARPIDDWLADPATPEDLRTRLETVRRLRDFASAELALPDNNSYRAYADLGRPFVVWNVVAATEFSTRPRQWCFPFAGCVSYKGWFDAGAAEAAGQALRSEGYEVFVHGVPAYSTLGWFADPMLNTTIGQPRQELARLLFHELAHQVAYASGDSSFNESFATVVEREGVRRWLARHGTDAEREAFAAADHRRAGFVGLILSARDELDQIYASPLPDEARRRAKAGVLAGVVTRYQDLRRAWGGYSGYDRWFAQPLTNAHVASVATYTELVPGFERLLAESGGNLPRFYAAVKRLASADAAERARVLDRGF